MFYHPSTPSESLHLSTHKILFSLSLFLKKHTHTKIQKLKSENKQKTNKTKFKKWKISKIHEVYFVLENNSWEWGLSYGVVDIPHYTYLGKLIFPLLVDIRFLVMDVILCPFPPLSLLGFCFGWTFWVLMQSVTVLLGS